MIKGKGIVGTTLLLIAATQAFAQRDTAKLYTPDEVIVTATRTAQKLSNSLLPTTLISSKQLQQTGTVRLQQILAEQAGLVLTTNFGTGIQMQGLSPSYTLILINGEPLVGRNGGVLDLTRVTLANIKKIEIIKGPVSSLYGSEALAGVINIITETASTSPKAMLQLRYGSFNSLDAVANVSTTINKWQLAANVNRNSSSGFTLPKATTLGPTQLPYTSYTTQASIGYRFNLHHNLLYTTRLYTEQQQGAMPVGNTLGSSTVSLTEINHTLTHTYNPNPKLQSITRLYSTQYTSNQLITKANNEVEYSDYFKQNFVRLENQTNYTYKPNHTLTAGAGTVYERLFTNRYSGIRTNNQLYAFVQSDWHPTTKLHLITGLRADANTTYQNRLSPKLALGYKLSPQLTLNASFGAGFKAPDFRQQFLNFTNNAAGGYTVYGANEVAYSTLQQQLQAGILQSLTPQASSLAQLKAETSNGYNVGINWKPTPKLTVTNNLFYNSVSNQIITQIIAYKAQNLTPVFSYFNINQAFTAGTETNIQYQVTSHIQVSGAYQYVLTADRQVWQQLKAGSLYGKPVGSLTSQQLTTADYGGLVNVSKHTANIKVAYQLPKQLTASVRAIYRSRFGVQDADGNGIVNRSDEYASGNTQLNITLSKAFSSGLSLQAGANNITNYTDVRWLPNQPGSNYFVTATYNFNIKK